jgi:glycosyltransferase involved in cell wall biosynthesis
LKKILLINNGLACGGIERTSVSLADYFYKKGFEVTVLALYKTNHFYKLNKEIKFIEPSFDRHTTSKYLYFFKFFFYLRKNLKKVNPDTILSFNEWTNVYVIVANIGLLYPIYVSEMMHPKAKLPWVTEILRKKLYRFTKGVVAQTSYGKEIIYQKTFAKNIHVIPNSVNVIEPVPISKTNLIIAIGRLEEVKGHRFLLEAFSRIKENDWILSIVGDGKEKKNLKKLANILGIQNRVVFHGQLVDFRKQLSEAQIYVLPSLKEGFPNSLIEAMSLPIACISGDFYEGKHDFVSNGHNGLLVEPGNVDQLKNALEELIINEKLRETIANNSMKVREDLAFDKIAIKYLKLIFSHRQNEL